MIMLDIKPTANAPPVGLVFVPHHNTPGVKKPPVQVAHSDIPLYANETLAIFSLVQSTHFKK